jgi:polyisoprenoid-binding protein YceI
MDDATMTTGTRVVDGIEFPVPGTWVIDPGHSDVGFVGRRFGLSRVRGRFAKVDGAVVFAHDVSQSTVEVTIDMASVDSGSTNRDDSLRSARFFDVERHPVATFRSTMLAEAGAAGTLTGDLTIKGISRPVVLDVEYLGCVRDPWNTERAIFRAAATINREHWGIDWNAVLDAGRLAVSKEVELEIDVELVPAAG